MLIDAINGIGRRTKIEDNILYMRYNNEYISANTIIVSYIIDNRNITLNRYMIYKGDIYTNYIYFPIIRKCKIHKLYGKSDNLCNCNFIVRDNNFENICNVQLINETYKENIINNIILESPNSLRAYLEINSGYVDYPELIVEFNWII